MTHWGLYDFHTEGGKLTQVTAVPSDRDPSPIAQNLIDGNQLNRIAKPAVRKGYLEGDKNSRRGLDEYIDIEWERAIPMVARELDRVRTQYGNASIFGGSYGWASAGRFHHALSQVHRFLNCIGGYTRSVNSYSYAAAEVILPHVIGDHEALLKSPPGWDAIAAHCELMVCFGGLPLRNGQITNGGMSKHTQREQMQRAKANDVAFVNVSPSRRDCAEFLDADWLAVRPGTDTALMLGLAHEIFTNDWHDAAFLDDYTQGFAQFIAYVIGDSDGEAKTAEWAGAITGLAPEQIKNLAKVMATKNVMISLSWSLSRHQHGEQTYWMGITLAAMLGQIGLPGCGVGLGYCAENKVGKNVLKRQLAALPQGVNPVKNYIPVARIADMLLNPGESFSFNGARLVFPDTKLIYWAGGNPFHHHQDLNRLEAAWQTPDTIICHELVWNAHARHADIVLPVASFLERNDIGGAPNEDVLVAMKQALSAFGDSKTDFEIFTLLSRELDVENHFTENLTETGWIKRLYDNTRRHHPELPDYETFWNKGEFHFEAAKPHGLFEAFRRNPKANPLRTRSGRIQLALPQWQHPMWHTPSEWLGGANQYPFSLVSHQPETRLHSQLDHGRYSQSKKIQGCEPVYMNPQDAKERGLIPGTVVKVFNARGAFHAGLIADDGQMPGVLHIATGAWWQPDENGTCLAGNPNAVTSDAGTSTIAQGPAALTCMVDVAKVDTDN